MIIYVALRNVKFYIIYISNHFNQFWFDKNLSFFIVPLHNDNLWRGSKNCYACVDSETLRVGRFGANFEQFKVTTIFEWCNYDFIADKNEECFSMSSILINSIDYFVVVFLFFKSFEIQKINEVISKFNWRKYEMLYKNILQGSGCAKESL